MNMMLDILQNHPSVERITTHSPEPRYVVTTETWMALLQGLRAGAGTLVGLWGETGWVYMAVYAHAHHHGEPMVSPLQPPPAAERLEGGHLDQTEEIGDRRDANGDYKSTAPYPDGRLLVASLPCPDGHFPSVARVHAPAHRLERALADLVGLHPLEALDVRPWLDHGRWLVSHPLGAATPRTEGTATPYPFLAAEGEGLHQIPVGPVHAGIIEPGHFRFTANGEAVVRLEERLGYVHKGIESLLCGASLDKAAKLVGRVSGDSTVAYALAFARAVEAATATVVPERSHWLRAVMAELERLANHLGDIGAICNDAAFSLMHAHCAILRERVLQASAVCFGHRLMMDCILPGGVTTDLTDTGLQHLHHLLVEIRQQFPQLVDLYDNTASLQERTANTGVTHPDLIQQFGCGGVIGRAGGRAFDVRRTPGYPPYDQLTFDVPVLTDSDVNARIWIRIREVYQSLALIEQMLQRLPPGDFRVPVSSWTQACEGLAWVEGFRGDILVWLRLNGDGTVARCHPRDPSWFQWPLLEAAIEGNIVADFPLCNKSFNGSYSGHDL